MTVTATGPRSSGESGETNGAGGGMMNEFKRNWKLYATFHMAAFMLFLVNRLEQSFARSLVHCDVPVDPAALFTGSARCGDRLLVIGQGQKLSSSGQGLECLCKVLAMIFLAVLADIAGRKPVLVLGLGCTGLSAVLFLIAPGCQSWIAFRLFALGQGLQGAFPVELLGAIVSNDMSNEAASDPVVVQQVSGLLHILSMVLVDILGVCLNSSTSTDFAQTWVIVAVLNILIALFAWTSCRETKPKFDVDRSKDGLWAGVKEEVSEYVRLLRTNNILRLNLMMFACVATAMTAMTIDMSFYIAFYSISQVDAVKHFSLKIVFAIMFFGVVDGVCKKMGSKRGFVAVSCSIVGGAAVLMPLYLLHPWVFLLHQYYAMVFSGIQPLVNAIDTRWFDQRLTSKFLSMKNLVQYFVGMAMNPAYGYLFDAHATGYAQRMAPYALQFSAMCIQMFLMMVPLWRLHGGLPDVLDRIDRERTDKAIAADRKND